MNKNLVLLLASGFFFALVWLNWQPTRPKPSVVADKPVPVKAAAPSLASEETVPKQEAQAKHYRPRQVSEAVRRKVDDFIRRYKDVPPEELNKGGELAPYMKRLEQLMDTPEFQSEMEKRMEAIKAARGLEHGMLNIGFGKLGDAESRAWLEAMFSDDAELLQEYFLNKLDGAIFEFAFDPTLENAGNGVTVKGAAPPAPAANKLPD
jgi:hypothetical protein